MTFVCWHCYCRYERTVSYHQDIFIQHSSFDFIDSLIQSFIQSFVHLLIHSKILAFTCIWTFIRIFFSLVFSLCLCLWIYFICYFCFWNILDFYFVSFAIFQRPLYGCNVCRPEIRFPNNKNSITNNANITTTAATATVSLSAC